MLITTTYALTTKILNSLTFNYWFMHTTQCISYVMYSTQVTWLASKILNKWNPYITRKARNVKHDHSGETNILQSNNTCHPQFWPRREWDPCGCNMVVEFEISGLHSESWRFVVEKGLLPRPGSLRGNGLTPEKEISLAGLSPLQNTFLAFSLSNIPRFHFGRSVTMSTRADLSQEIAYPLSSVWSWP